MTETKPSMRSLTSSVCDTFLEIQEL